MKSSVAVVVPVYREGLLPDEEFAVRHLRKCLGRYDGYQISPASLQFRIEGLQVRRYDNAFFANVSAYSRLCLSKAFYQDFAGYDYILIYQLDCLVFQDELEHWCRQGYDYIGAPLFKVKDDPTSGFSGACNGGLSLRKVSAFLKVLNSRRYVEEKVTLLSDLFHQPFIDVRPAGPLATWRKRIQVARAVRQGVEKYAANYSLNEDHFWSGRATYFDPAFRVAPPEAALPFAFESAPGHCYELNARKLPFGVHAWQKYDRGFWQPRLLP